MNNLTVSASPHITNKSHSTRMIMLDVIIALTPALIAAILFFGYHVLINAVVCVASCICAELLFNMIVSKKFDKESIKKASIWDFSSIVTGLLIALNIPSKVVVKSWDLNIYEKGYNINTAGYLNHINFSFDTVFICIIGSFFAIMVVKMLFGGIGKNFANPAATARIFLTICFGLVAVGTIGAAGSVQTGATWLSTANKSTSNQSMFLRYFLGNRASAAAGETCMIAILLGYIYLSVRRVIDFRIPLILVGSAAVFAFIFDGLGRSLTGARLFNNMVMNVLSGGLVFGAVFMATDYSTTPNTFVGHSVFAIGVAFFTVLIRRFTPMAEGMSFAILIMNLVSPLIDKYIYPKPFGSVKKPKKVRHKTVSEPKKAKLPQNGKEINAENLGGRREGEV